MTTREPNTGAPSNTPDPTREAEAIAQLLVDLAETLAEVKRGTSKAQQVAIKVLTPYRPVWCHVMFRIERVCVKKDGTHRDSNQLPELPAPPPEDGTPTAVRANKVVKLIRELSIQLEAFMRNHPYDWNVLHKALLPHGGALAYCNHVIMSSLEMGRGAKNASSFFDIAKVLK